MPPSEVAVHRPSERTRMNDRRRDKMAFLHGGYYVVAGLWPVIHLRSFAAVTGPKPEGWLVKATGLLITSIGVALLTASRTRERITSGVLGLTAALSLGGVSLRYAAQRRISPIFYLDAGLHLALAAAWAALLLPRALRRGRGEDRTAAILVESSRGHHEKDGQRGKVLTPGLAMSAAGIASVLTASAIHHGSPWSGLNALSSGIGLVGTRPPKRFDPLLALASVAMFVAGSVAMVGIQQRLPRGIARNRLGTAVSIGLGCFGSDRFLLRRTLVPALLDSLGRGGTVFKYAAMGTAAALAARPRGLARSTSTSTTSEGAAAIQRPPADS